MAEKEIELPANVKKIDRSELMNISSWLVENLRGRLSRARFVEYDSDGTKLQYLRVFIQAVQTHNSILRDDDLESIKARLAALEENKPRERERE